MNIQETKIYKNFSWRISLSLLLLLLIPLSLGSYFFFFKKESTSEQQDVPFTKVDRAIISSIAGTDILSLQNMFLDDLRNKRNDANVKAEAYFVMHRYFDNGGNIYELYDFVNTHPELAFLKKAEKIYPQAFKEIKEHSLPTSYSTSGRVAYLSYMGVLNQKNYLDVAGRATVANQFMEMTRSFVDNPTLLSQVKDPVKFKENNIKASLIFANQSKRDVRKIIDGEITTNDILGHSMIVGLNQYASTLRYFKYFGIPFESPKTAEEIFDYSMNNVDILAPELSLFTSLLNASTLLLDKNVADTDIKFALKRIYSLDLSGVRFRPTSLVGKIFNSKNRVEDFITGTTVKEKDYSLYGKRNMIEFARRVPEFKKWLTTNGWSEGDFVLPE